MVQRRVAVLTRRRRTLALLTSGPRPVWARVWLRHCLTILWNYLLLQLSRSVFVLWLQSCKSGISLHISPPMNIANARYHRFLGTDTWFLASIPSTNEVQIQILWMLELGCLIYWQVQLWIQSAPGRQSVWGGHLGASVSYNLWLVERCELYIQSSTM